MGKGAPAAMGGAYSAGGTPVGLGFAALLRLLPAIVLCVIGLEAGSARAQTAAELLEGCRNAGQAAAPRIDACTRLIGATDDEGIRAEAHLQRGILYELGDKAEAAVADYGAAIKLRPANP
ncbi:MAG TPA: hypothetical protein VG758_16900, partial [Hyphomicrobiaceae bacterium]|nr:hypothetical protein [Hyphomicrobiaceae bacterium]